MVSRFCWRLQNRYHALSSFPSAPLQECKTNKQQNKKNPVSCRMGMEAPRDQSLFSLVIYSNTFFFLKKTWVPPASGACLQGSCFIRGPVFLFCLRISSFGIPYPTYWILFEAFFKLGIHLLYCSHVYHYHVMQSFQAKI